MSHIKKQFYISRLLALLLAAVLLLVGLMPVARATDDSGSCGASLTWTLSGGTLTIEGTGAMTDYDQWNLPPWYEYREEILWISLPEGLTNVGSMAFYGCGNLGAVSLPSTVRAVGELAFSQCFRLSALGLNSGLVSIGRSAFERCESLFDLRLPGTVTTIDYHAFYRCSGLQYVLVPASVTQLGNGVFSYCSSLIRADVNARISELPFWTFYGCDSLNVVYLADTVQSAGENAFSACDNLRTVVCGGSEEDGQKLLEQIEQNTPTFDAEISTQLSGESEAYAESGYVQDDSLILTATTLTSSENATISSATTTIRTADEPTVVQADVTASITEDEGWIEFLEYLMQTMQAMEEKEADGVSVDPVTATAYISGGSGEVPQAVLTELAGKEVTLSVQSADGGDIAIDGAVLAPEQIESGAAFSYRVTESTPDECSLPGGSAAFRVEFLADMPIKAEVMIQLPGQYAYSTASLYQYSGREAEFLQSVMVDAENCAHFYLDGVYAATEYAIGIDVPEAEAPILPASLLEEYGLTETSQGIEYVVTGRTSSWGMNITQVTWIMLGALVGVVAVVGVTMFLLNKRKLKMGYVPDLGEEE